MSQKIKVAVAEDHELVRKGYISLLSEDPTITITGEASNGKELLELLKRSEPDVVLLDLEMPVMNGQETLEIINKRFPNTRTIIISMHFEEMLISEYIIRGARGYLPKNCNIETLVDAIYTVQSDGYYFNKRISMAIVSRLLREKSINPVLDELALTERETEILKQICEDRTNKQIADSLRITVRTVDFHRGNIYKKTKSSTVAGLVMYAVRNGLVSVG